MKVLAALARNTVLQAIRLRAVAFVGLLTLALFPFILLHLKSTGSPKAELQVLLTYSIGFISFVLSLLTIFLATWSLCGEIQDRQIFILDTKPVHRWQILLGKWAGILLLDTAILAAMAGFTYALIRWIEGRASPRDRQQIWDELLVGRKGVRPTLPDLSAQVREEYEKRKVEGALPEGAAEENVLLQIRREVYQRQETVPPRMTKTWEFRDLPRPDDIMARRPLALRFKLYTSNPVAKRHIKGKWRIWARYGNTQFQVPPGKTPAGAFQEITLPAGVLPQEGKLLVAFTNLETSDEPAVFPLSDGIELLYPTLSFQQNFLHGCALILVRIGFLAALGIAASTLLTFPMAMTVTLTGWLLCSVAGYMLEVADYPLLVNIYSSRRAEGPDWIDNLFRLYLKTLFSIAPNFSYYNPVTRLVDGREVGFPLVGAGLVFLLSLRGGVLAVLGGILFQQRELAKLAR